MHRQTVALAIAITLRLSSSASAQPLESSPRTQTDFSRVRLKVGDHVYVLDPERKVEVSGRLTRLSADELSVDGYQFVPKPGLKVERDGDTIWDGAALGFLIGGLERRFANRAVHFVPAWLWCCARACSNVSPMFARQPRRCVA
jgi:hypothetical protein